MGQALYRKHRPKKLAEVIGQEHITQTLEQALKQGRISHAYLFTGPRGTGKTSIARILAHEINDLPYDDDSTHIDIIEIDAASNRRIDEIRELRDKVHIAPTSARYKVYIIDEVHMLTREAFNALLKTLEEPPAHVVFILATTDAHKLPETIISRTQRYNFKPVARDEVASHLGAIAKKEKIKVSREALELLAEHGEGSFRDSISLLDQASSRGEEVTADEVRQLLGLPPAEMIGQLLQELVNAPGGAEVAKSLTNLYAEGYQAAVLAKQMSKLVRAQLLSGQSVLAPDQSLGLLRALIEVPTSRDPERLLEVILLENMVNTGTVTVKESSKQTLQVARVTGKSPGQIPVPEPEPRVSKEITVTKSTVEPDEPSEPPAQKPAAIGEPLDATAWPQVLAALKQKHNTLYGVVRMAQPTFRSDGTIELAFAFAFHQKRISEATNKQKLLDTIQEVTGQPVAIECVHDKSVSTPQPEPVPISQKDEPGPPPVESSEDLTVISNIFGGGELLES